MGLQKKGGEIIIYQYFINLLLEFYSPGRFGIERNIGQLRSMLNTCWIMVENNDL